MLWLIQANGVLRCRLLLLQYKFQLCEAPRALGHASPHRREGGHDVPADRILARYPRTLANLKQAVRLADAALLHDSEAVLPGAHRLITACEGASTQVLHEPLPAWAKKMLGMGR